MDNTITFPLKFSLPAFKYLKLIKAFYAEFVNYRWKFTPNNDIIKLQIFKKG